jgi:hypothetical protein
MNAARVIMTARLYHTPGEIHARSSGARREADARPVELRWDYRRQCNDFRRGCTAATRKKLAMSGRSATTLSRS